MSEEEGSSQQEVQSSLPHFAENPNSNAELTRAIKQASYEFCSKGLE